MGIRNHPAALLLMREQSYLQTRDQLPTPNEPVLAVEPRLWLAVG